MSRISGSHFLAQLAAQSASISNHQITLDSFQAQLFSEATRSTSILAMTAGGLAYRIVRASLLPLFSPLPQMLGTALSSAIALGVEVGTFRAVHHGLSPTGEEYWDARAWGSQCLDFAGLKGAGAIFKSHNALFRHTVQSLAMMAGEEAGVKIGLREENQASFAERFAHASAMNLALGAGTMLASRIAGGALQRVEGNLERIASSAKVQAGVANSAAPRMASTTPAAAINEMVYAKLVRQDVLHQLSVVVGSDLMRRAAFMENRGGMGSFAGEVVNLYFNADSLTFSPLPLIHFEAGETLRFQVPENGRGLQVLPSTRFTLEKYARCATTRQGQEFYKNMLNLDGLNDFEWFLPAKGGVRDHVMNLEACVPELGSVDNIARDFVPLLWLAENPKTSLQELGDIAAEIRRLQFHKAYGPFMAYFECLCRARGLKVEYADVFQRSDEEFYRNLRRLYLRPPFGALDAIGKTKHSPDPWLFDSEVLEASVNRPTGESANYPLIIEAENFTALGDSRSAVAVLQRLVPMNRQHYRERYDVGQLWIELGQVQRGVELVGQFLKDMPETDRTHLEDAASILMWAGESESLATILRQLEGSWNRGDAKAELLYLRALMGQRREVLPLLQATLVPQTSTSHIPTLLVNLGDREAALDHLASQVGPDLEGFEAIIKNTLLILDEEMDFPLRALLQQYNGRPKNIGYLNLLRRLSAIARFDLVRAHLTKVFEENSEREVQLATSLLDEFPDPDFKPWVLRVLGRNPRITSDAMSYLGQLGQPSLIPHLLTYVQQPGSFWNDSSRQGLAISAARALARLGEREHSKALYEYALRNGVNPQNRGRLENSLSSIYYIRMAHVLGRYS